MPCFQSACHASSLVHLLSVIWSLLFAQALIAKTRDRGSRVHQHQVVRRDVAQHAHVHPFLALAGANQRLPQRICRARGSLRRAALRRCTSRRRRRCIPRAAGFSRPGCSKQTWVSSHNRWYSRTKRPVAGTIGSSESTHRMWFAAPAGGRGPEPIHSVSAPQAGARRIASIDRRLRRRTPPPSAGRRAGRRPGLGPPGPARPAPPTAAHAYP